MSSMKNTFSVYRNRDNSASLPYEITLPFRSDPYYPNKDPRKVWLYSGLISGRWGFQDLYEFRTTVARIYRFANEQDALLFQLRWEGSDI